MPAYVTPEPIASHQRALACTGPAGDPRTGAATPGQAADMSELPRRILRQSPLTGAFDIAACQASGDSSLPQPQDDAAILLSAFEASTSAKPAGHQISASQLRSLFGLK
jgi:hypothetical protein